MPGKYQTRRVKEIKERDASRQKREPKVVPAPVVVAPATPTATPAKRLYEIPIKGPDCTIRWKEAKLREKWGELCVKLGLTLADLEDFILKHRQPVAVPHVRTTSPRSINYYHTEG